MSDTRPKTNSAALIIGCGYLGRRLAALLIDKGVAVFGTTRSPAKAQSLASLGVRPLLVDVTQPVTLSALKPAIDVGQLDVFHLVAPGRPSRTNDPAAVVLEGIANVARTLKRANLRRAVLTSSTAVYGQCDGATVDADTIAEPSDDRGKLLQLGEQLWRQPGDRFRVVRLAGLYGPGRVIGQSAVMENSPIVGNPDAMLNLIHVNDAAALLLNMAECESAGVTELGCDDHPATRIEYYRHLAKRLGAPQPQVLDDLKASLTLGLNVDRLRRTTNKRCDNALTRRRTGWKPAYPTYRQGLEHSLTDGPKPRASTPAG